MPALPLVLIARLLTSHGDDLKPAPTDQIDVVATPQGDSLTWRDAEDRLDGTLTPSHHKEGQPIQVNVRIGSFYGETFKGPVQLTLRGKADSQGETVTVPGPGPEWTHTFTPRAAGLHSLDVVFRTTRTKLLHAQFDVKPAFPLTPAQGATALLVIAALGVVAVQTLRSLKDPTARPKS